MTLGITERDFGTWLADAAKLFQFRWAHFRPAQTKHGWVTPMEGHKGFPDYVLVRPPRLIFAELKVLPETQIKGRPSDEQAAWLADLATIPGAECFVWRPVDKDDILDILRRGPRA